MYFQLLVRINKKKIKIIIFSCISLTWGRHVKSPFVLWLSYKLSIIAGGQGTWTFGGFFLSSY